MGNEGCRKEQTREIPKEAEEWNKIIFETLWQVWILSEVASVFE